MQIGRRTGLSLVGFALLGAVSAVTFACSGPTYVVQQYPGDARSSEEIAVIRVNGKDPVLLDSLDGAAVAVQLPEDSRLHVEVLPGPHEVGILNVLDASRPPTMVSFVAEANKVYRPIIETQQGQTTGRMYEVDRRSDALLRDVTFRPPPPAAPPPPPPPAPAPAPEPPPTPEPAPPPAVDGGGELPADAGVAPTAPADAGPDAVW